MIHVIKIGGALLLDPESCNTFIRTFAQLDAKKILVHGGGEQANQLMRRLNVEPKKIDGRRITDAESLRIVQMVYAGKVNKDLVVKLQAEDCLAIGLSGADANLIEAVKRPVGEIDFGYAGDIVSVNAELIIKFLEMELIPVVCSLTHDKKGQMLNTNADTIASGIATALSKHHETKLWYLFDKKGLLKDRNDEESVIEEISIGKVDELVSKGVLNAGILPKVHTAKLALQNGVSQVGFCHYSQMRYIPHPTMYTKLW